MKRLIPILGIAIVMMLGASACTEKYATPTADTHLCVYDGSERGGQKLKFQLGPSESSKKIDDNDQIVTIPASNRFFMAAKNHDIKDPLAPDYYQSFAARNVGVQVEGQVRFKFRSDNPCEWYSVHGRRNEPLNFNARGSDALQAGWFRFLAENFGVTMQQAADQVTNQFDPFGLIYHYPVNANPDTGQVDGGAKPGEDTDLIYGRALGVQFTKLLNANLGNEYFCGIDPNPDDPKDVCPDMTFQVIAVHSTDPAIEAGRAAVEKARDDLRNAQLRGEAAQAQAAALASSQDSERQILQSQLDEQRLKNEINDAQCIRRAELGLACDGSRPPVIVQGSQAN